MDKEHIHNEGFQVPEGYFEQLESSVLGRLDEGMEVPEGYFENIEDRIVSKVKPQRTISISRYLSWSAAAVILLSLGFWTFSSNNQGRDETLMVAMADEDVYLDYLLDNPEELESLDLSPFLDDSMNELDDETMIEFLDESEFDLEDLESLI